MGLIEEVWKVLGRLKHNSTMTPETDGRFLFEIKTLN